MSNKEKTYFVCVCMYVCMYLYVCACVPIYLSPDIYKKHVILFASGGEQGFAFRNRKMT